MAAAVRGDIAGWQFNGWWRVACGQSRMTARPAGVWRVQGDCGGVSSLKSLKTSTNLFSLKYKRNYLKLFLWVTSCTTKTNIYHNEERWVTDWKREIDRRKEGSKCASPSLLSSTGYSGWWLEERWLSFWAGCWRVTVISRVRNSNLGLCFFRFKCCVSQLSVDQISRNLVNF